MNTHDIAKMFLEISASGDLSFEMIERFAHRIAAEERESCIEILSRTEFTSLEHMPSEAALLIRARSDA